MTDQLSHFRKRIDQHLIDIASASTVPAPLRPAVDAAFRSAGKRVRGILVAFVADAVGLKPEKVLDCAAAFEMIHACSLVLDDLPAMDDAELRRGEPTLHRKFGEDLAILAAVGLLNDAYGLIAKNHAEVRPRRWTASELIERVVTAVGWDGTIGGEAVDLHSEAAKLDFDTLEYIHSRKTGALFVAAAASGAMLANASHQVLAAVEAYAKNLGLAFQITDDILDVTGTVETLGKDVGKDEGKLTFVKLAGIDGARELTHELIDTSVGAIAVLGSKGVRLRELAISVRDRVR